MKNKKILIVSIIIFLIILVIASFIVYGIYKENKEKIYGTYHYEDTRENTYIDGTVQEYTVRCTLILNSDGTATYSAANGYSYENTRGTYTYENEKITYTKEYFNYENGDNNPYHDSNSKQEIFTVLDNGKLEGTYHDSKIELIKSTN